MFARIRDFFSQLQELWGKLNNRAKIIIGASAFIVFTALVFMIFVLGDANYQPLFEQLAHEDAGEIVDELENRGVSYRLEDGGSTILVPADQVHDMRLALAGEGLPASGQVGFEVFDDVQFGTTDFERRVNLYRAMGGELSRSIESMEAIASARVQITAPEESLFVSEERPAEASVMLNLEPRHQLDESMARAIGNLVASGVPDLSLENVTIVDTAGNMIAAGDLADGDDFNAREISTNQREMERDYEEKLTERLQGMLTRILGPDNFTVQVESRMNFDRRERESHTYLPIIDEEGLPRSREELREIYYGGETPEEAGAPGTDSNIPGYLTVEEMEEEGYYERTEETINYEMDEIVEREEFAPGQLEHLSISVMVDDEMAEDDLLILEDSIQAAVGFDPERDDTINVSSLEFDRTIEEEIEAARAEEEAQRRRQQIIYSVLIVAILLITLTAALILRRRMKTSEEMAVPQGATVDEMVEDEEEEEVELPEEELSEEEKKARKMREELHEMAEDQPEEMAELIKSWIIEE
ncbi:flagellar basal-body MS-ring/collar protein FliF [Halarsenatibacter silvermanii]|uniref:Flagellar M-ring protein n=1 Tax=Halarsenatibacter silvermanii TaxID=321763 RepID=A0A1G9MH93_9FIRM|nr:flagellar basal-body MS-ring/collar protein FliF [Halarsenatibacter silvermanii]SDL73494.1 flagellar M-ring protein FliF [Halarsenatibacter silvermanii]